MQASLAAKNTCICHAELPAVLIPTTMKRKRDDTIVSPTPAKNQTWRYPVHKGPTQFLKSTCWPH
eukprot:13470967-Ditylum_brightwellii.AAC.1